MKSSQYNELKGGSQLISQVESYWNEVLSGAKVEIPDKKLLNAIIASQIHSLMVTWNSEKGRVLEPWYSSMEYGVLDNDSHATILAMDYFGYHDFANRSIEYFIPKTNQDGLLTTGYSLIGTGWHLWELGDHFYLTSDHGWVKEKLSHILKMAHWIMKEREKTKRFDLKGNKVPEYGLMPPGLIWDWFLYAYYFFPNGYYCAALQSAANMLKAVGHPEAETILKNAQEYKNDILTAYRLAQSLTPVYPLRDNTWVAPYPCQVNLLGFVEDFYPNADGDERASAYDVEGGAHQLVALGIMDPNEKGVGEMMDHIEDVQFMLNGWLETDHIEDVQFTLKGWPDYSAEKNEEDWFNLGGFSKVQPYLSRHPYIYAMRDEVKPFIRTYFNSIASTLNTEDLAVWEHFNAYGGWNCAGMTGNFLEQTRKMLVLERGDELWLAPLVTNNWLKDGEKIEVTNMPTYFGPVSYKIKSSVSKGFIEAEIDSPQRKSPSEIVLRLRHPEEKKIKAVLVNGKTYSKFDASRDIIKLKGFDKKIMVTAEY